MVAAAFVPTGPIVIGLDHTLERCRGPRIGPSGRFCDPILRADAAKPGSRGLRWLSAMALTEVPFAGPMLRRLAMSSPSSRVPSATPLEP